MQVQKLVDNKAACHGGRFRTVFLDDQLGALERILSIDPGLFVEAIGLVYMSIDSLQSVGYNISK